MSGWGCIHESEGRCGKVGGRPCDPGMKGCVLAGRFRFTNPSKNRPPKAGDGAAPPMADGQGDDLPDPVSDPQS